MNITTLLKPIIGVFIDTSSIRKLNKQKRNFRFYARLFELAQAGAEMKVTLYFFSHGNVNLGKSTVFGTFYDKKRKRWRRRKFPLPDVLYNRRLTDQHDPKAERIVSFLNKHNVIRINSRTYFDKWDVHEQLSQVPHFQSYLPMTVLYRKESDLESFMENHDTVFLKGTVGGRGKWVVKARKLPDGKYEYLNFRDRLVTVQAKSENEFVRKIGSFFKGRPFIIQDPIRLLKVNGGPVDFRAELRRNDNGQLTISGISARVGRSHSPITIHSSAYPIKVFLIKHLKRSKEEIEPFLTNIRTFIISTYTTLEEIYGPFGELGIDFAIDRDGKIWFIESNARSAKVSFMKAFGKHALRKSYIGVLSYAKYLYEHKKGESVT